MTSGKYNTRQQLIYFKAYTELSELENAINHLKEENAALFQVSILGKVNQFNSDKYIEPSQDGIIIKSYWKELFGRSVNFGIFQNPESGFVFIVGSLATTFLHEINGKPLATLSSGPYGIFRGIGVNEICATNYLKLLYRGDYLLILRGYEDKILSLNSLLKSV